MFVIAIIMICYCSSADGNLCIFPSRSILRLQSSIFLRKSHFWHQGVALSYSFYSFDSVLILLMLMMMVSRKV